MKILKDLFYGPGNEHLDLARVVGGLAPATLVAAAVWNVYLGLPIELGPTGFGGGFAAVLTAAAALIYAKDKAATEAKAEAKVP